MHWESLLAVIHGLVLNLPLEFASCRSPVVCTYVSTYYLSLPFYPHLPASLGYLFPMPYRHFYNGNNVPGIIFSAVGGWFRLGKVWSGRAWVRASQIVPVGERTRGP